MNGRTTLVIVGLFLLLGGYIFFFELNKTPAQLGGPPPRPAPQVFDLPSGQVARLELRDLRKARTIELARIDKAWQFEKPTTQIADSSRVNDTVDGFAVLHASRVFTDVTELAQYGVLTGTLEARIILRDSSTYAITVGNKTAAGDSYYAIYTGSKQAPVFIIASRLVDEWLGWFDNPPYPPTPTPTFTPPPTVSATQTVAPATAAPTGIPTQVPIPAATPTR